jgi:hypothetical protein
LADDRVQIVGIRGGVAADADAVRVTGEVTGRIGIGLLIGD